MIGAYILIIGAMKSGTSTLFAQLAQHPAIAPAKPKEPGFFAFEEVYAQGWDWYESLFKFDPTEHQYALEGSTDYTKQPFTDRTLERIRDAEAQGRRFKLIYIMRNPIKRIESHAHHVQRVRMEVGRSRSPRKTHSFDQGISPVNLAVSDYADQLAPYHAWWQRGDLKLLTLEELTQNPEETMASLGTFLDLPDLNFSSDVEHQNKTGTNKQIDPMVMAARKSGPAAVLKRLIPAGMRKQLLDSLSTKVEVKGRFDLTSEERAELLPRYRDQVQKLAETYGFEPGWVLE